MTVDLTNATHVVTYVTVAVECERDESGEWKPARVNLSDDGEPGHWGNTYLHRDPDKDGECEDCRWETTNRGTMLYPCGQCEEAEAQAWEFEGDLNAEAFGLVAETLKAPNNPMVIMGMDPGQLENMWGSMIGWVVGVTVDGETTDIMVKGFEGETPGYAGINGCEPDASNTRPTYAWDWDEIQSLEVY